MDPSQECVEGGGEHSFHDFLSGANIYKLELLVYGKEALEMLQKLSELFPLLFLSNYWFTTQIIENSGPDVIISPLQIPFLET